MDCFYMLMFEELMIDESWLNIDIEKESSTECSLIWSSYCSDFDGDSESEFKSEFETDCSDFSESFFYSPSIWSPTNFEMFSIMIFDLILLLSLYFYCELVSIWFFNRIVPFLRSSCLKTWLLISFIDFLLSSRVDFLEIFWACCLTYFSMI